MPILRVLKASKGDFSYSKEAALDGRISEEVQRRTVITSLS